MLASCRSALQRQVLQRQLLRWPQSRCFASGTGGTIMAKLRGLLGFDSSALAEEEARLAAQEGEIARLRQEVTIARRDARDHVLAYKAKYATQNESTDCTEAAPHPILGTLVAELPRKKIFMTPISKLANISVWEKQRAFRGDRALGMAEAVIDKAAKEGGPARPFAGSIVICDRGKDFAGDWSDLVIVDGQHRAGALALLLSRHAFGSDQTPPAALVEVHNIQETEGIGTLFREINQAEPVAEIDLPADETRSLHQQIAQLRETIDFVADTLKQQYPLMFKPSARCRPPHLHQDTLRDRLFTTGTAESALEMAQAGEDAGSKLLHWIYSINEQLRERTDDEWTERIGKPDKNGTKVMPKSAVTALAKARKEGFFLGLDRDWLS